MSTWEERMAERHQDRIREAVEAARRTYLGNAFLPFYPPGPLLGLGGVPRVEILPEIIAAQCLGITYGDPGPKLPAETCRQCWGERHVWLGNCWGIEHTGEGLTGCGHECHEGEIWLA